MKSSVRKLALKMVNQEGCLIGDVAQKLGISNRQVYNWLKASANESEYRLEPEDEYLDSRYICSLAS